MKPTPTPEEIEKALETADACAARPPEKKRLGPMFGGHLEVLAAAYRSLLTRLSASEAKAEALTVAYESAEKCAVMQTAAYQNAMANAERLFEALEDAERVLVYWKEYGVGGNGLDQRDNTAALRKVRAALSHPAPSLEKP
jgi:hypothetical protein